MKGTYRARRPEILGEKLPSLNSRKRSRGTTIERKGLHVKGAGAAVGDDCLLCRCKAQDGSKCDESGLHDEIWDETCWKVEIRMED
jgi:hypothetical protein